MKQQSSQPKYSAGGTIPTGRAARIPQHPTGPAPVLQPGQNTAPHQYNNPAYAHDIAPPIVLGSKALPQTKVNGAFATEPAEPIKIRTRTPQDIKEALQPHDYTSVALDSRVFAPESYRHPSQANGANGHSPRAFHNYQDNESIGLSNSKGASIKPGSTREQLGSREQMLYPQQQLTTSLTPVSPGSSRSLPRAWEEAEPPSYHSHKSGIPDSSKSKAHKYEKDKDDDELDVVDRVMQPGASAQPLVDSIREELQKLATRTGGSTSISK